MRGWHEDDLATFLIALAVGAWVTFLLWFYGGRAGLWSF